MAKKQIIEKLNYFVNLGTGPLPGLDELEAVA